MKEWLICENWDMCKREYSEDCPHYKKHRKMFGGSCNIPCDSYNRRSGKCIPWGMPESVRQELDRICDV